MENLELIDKTDSFGKHLINDVQDLNKNISYIINDIAKKLLILDTKSYHLRLAEFHLKQRIEFQKKFGSRWPYHFQRKFTESTIDRTETNPIVQTALIKVLITSTDPTKILDIMTGLQVNVYGDGI